MSEDRSTSSCTQGPLSAVGLRSNTACMSTLRRMLARALKSALARRRNRMGGGARDTALPLPTG
eukprot:408666-Lingulodinium_polyedra.AAC.1